jgi:hypothetical protein
MDFMPTQPARRPSPVVGLSFCTDSEASPARNPTEAYRANYQADLVARCLDTHCPITAAEDESSPHVRCKFVCEILAEPIYHSKQDGGPELKLVAAAFFW